MTSTTSIISSCLHRQQSLTEALLSPFVVLAVEEAVEDVAERADVVEVVQDDHGGKLHVCLLGVTLLRQRAQVLPQVL